MAGLVLELVQPAEVDLLETERAEQLDCRLIEFRGLDLRDAEILFLQVPQDVHQQELAQALPAHVVANLQRQHARRRRAQRQLKPSISQTSARATMRLVAASSRRKS